MHWVSILSALTLALATAYFVLIKQWSLMLALALVGGFSLGLVAAVVVGVGIVAKPADRAVFVRTVIATVRRDLSELFRWLRLKH